MDDRTHPGSGGDEDTDVGASAGREARLAGLRAAVELGLEDIRTGRVVDLDEAFDRIEAMLDELEAAQRS